MSYPRRTVLGTGVVLMAMGAGCTGNSGPSVQLDSGYTDVKITNGDDSLHDVSMTAEGDGFSEQETRTSQAGETAVFEGFVPKLDYDHHFDVEISVDGDRRLTENYRMEHDLAAYEFRITDDGDVDEVEVGY